MTLLEIVPVQALEVELAWLETKTILPFWSSAFLLVLRCAVLGRVH